MSDDAWHIAELESKDSRAPDWVWLFWDDETRSVMPREKALTIIGNRADLNTALSLLSAYGMHHTTCDWVTEKSLLCTCGYAERVTPFLDRMIEVKK